MSVNVKSLTRGLVGHIPPLDRRLSMDDPTFKIRIADELFVFDSLANQPPGIFIKY